MSYTKKEYIDILHQKLIGLNVLVVPVKGNAPNHTGKIIDETHNMFIIVSDNMESIKKIPKKGNLFQFRLKDVIIEVNGKLLTGRPENRIKMKRKY